MLIKITTITKFFSNSYMRSVLTTTPNGELKLRCQNSIAAHNNHIKLALAFVEKFNMISPYTLEQIKFAEGIFSLHENIMGEDYMLGMGIISRNNIKGAVELTKRNKIIAKSLNTGEGKFIHLPEISNIIVSATHRQQGLGFAITKKLIDLLDHRDILVIATNKNHKKAIHAERLMNKIKRYKVVNELGNIELYKHHQSIAYKIMRTTHSDPKIIYQQILKMEENESR